MNSAPIRWHDFMETELGTPNWIVATSLTPRLRAQGFAKAISQRCRDDLRRQWLDMHPGVLAAAALPTRQVRRLTPTECECLMGVPDGFTAITYRGKPAADGARYKALGNSMAVNMMHWVGASIHAAEMAWQAAA